MVYSVSWPYPSPSTPSSFSHTPRTYPHVTPNVLACLAFNKPLSPISATHMYMWIKSFTVSWVIYQGLWLQNFSCYQNYSPSFSSHQKQLAPELGWDLGSPSLLHAGIFSSWSCGMTAAAGSPCRWQPCLVQKPSLNRAPPSSGSYIVSPLIPWYSLTLKFSDSFSLKCL